MAKKKLPIVSKVDAEFNKSNSAIGVVVTEGQLSFLDRKVFNVFIAKAHQLQVRGRGAPPDVDAALVDEYFWVQCRELVKDASFNSNDTETFIKAIDNLQSVRVRAQGAKGLFLERLMGPAYIHKESGRGQGGTVWVGFRFDPVMHQYIMNPKSDFTPISLDLLSKLNSGPGLALYEIAKRYATSPNPMAGMPWEWWYHYLRGSNVNEPVKVEYKEFNDRTLKKAIAEVNSMEHVFVEFRVSKKIGRKVAELQMLVSLIAQGQLDFPEPPVIDTALIDALKAIGFSDIEAKNLTAAEDHELLKKTITLLQQRQANKDVAQVHSPTAYFRKLIREKSALGIPTAAQKPQQKVPAIIEGTATVVDDSEEKAAAREAALVEFDAMSKLEQECIIKQVVEGNPALVEMSRKPNAPMFRRVLAQWLTKVQ